MYFESIKASDLPARLKELGYDISEDAVDYIPGGHQSRQGLLKNGEIEEIWIYSLDFVIRFLDDIKEFDLPGKMKERGFEVDPTRQYLIPYEFKDGKYGYDLEKIPTYLGYVTRYNLAAVLKENGYDINKDYLYEIKLHCSEYDAKSIEHYKMEKVTAYINSVNHYNLPARVKELGYEITPLDIKVINKDHGYTTYENGFSSYNIDKVIEYLKEKSRKHIVTDMKKEMENFSDGTSSFGNNTKEFYEQAPNHHSHFPISKWYAQTYNTIPDACYIGQIYIDEILSDPRYKVKWFYKQLTDWENINTKTEPEVLRAFGDQQIREILLEGLVELEDGMFVLLAEGRFDKNNETMYATAILFYKEGIHDPTDFLVFAATQYVVHYETGTLGLLYHDQNGFNTHDFEIPKPNIDFNLHYNPGFDQVHNTIYSALWQDKGKGLVLLHGKPGTGKTTYIRYLINQLNKNKIFVPPNLTELLSDPGFIPFLMRNPNSILFVEDAENVLRSRENGMNNQAVSNILNITDGLLSDCLNIQIVATFNTHLKNVDPALLRKGRLIAQYEFTDLRADRAEKLADSLKVWLDDTSNLTVADIYAKVKMK